MTLSTLRLGRWWDDHPYTVTGVVFLVVALMSVRPAADGRLLLVLIALLAVTATFPDDRSSDHGSDATRTRRHRRREGSRRRAQASRAA